MDIVGTSVPSDLLRLIRLAISLNYSFLAPHPSSDSPFFTPTPLYYGSIGWITTRMCFVDSETFLHSPFLITSSSLNPTCSSLSRRTPYLVVMVLDCLYHNSTSSLHPMSIGLGRINSLCRFVTVILCSLS